MSTGSPPRGCNYSGIVCDAYMDDENTGIRYFSAFTGAGGLDMGLPDYELLEL